MNEYITFNQLREELCKKPDLVKVVRCRDCKQMIPCYYNDELVDVWCKFFHISTHFNYFCSWGRKEK